MEAIPMENENCQWVLEILSTQQTKTIFNMIENNNYLIYEIFEVIAENVFKEVSESESKTIIPYSILLIGELTKLYGIPVALYFNNMEFLINIHKISENGFKNEVSDLLELWMNTFHFDKDKRWISYIADFWMQLNPETGSYPCKGDYKSKFVDFFIHIQNLLSKIEEISSLNEFDKKQIHQQVKDILKKIELFEDKEFNFLEIDLAKFYYNELSKAFLTLESNLNSNKMSEEKPLEIEQVLNFEKGTFLYKNEPLLTENNKYVQNHENDHVHNELTRFRRSFIFNERLNEDENKITEYKNYQFPFNDQIRGVLKKTICSFINRRGGRIYLGIDDNRCVQGMDLTYKQRDMLKLEIQDLIKTFEPDVVNQELVVIFFLPVMRPNDDKPIPGVFVVKILVKQGDTSQLYSVSKALLECYIRNDGRVDLLNARETADYIKKKDKNPEKGLPAEEFEDPSPEKICDVFYRNENKHFNMAQIRFQQGLKNKPKSHYNQQIKNQSPRQLGPNKNQNGDWKVKAGIDPSQEIFEVSIQGLPIWISQSKFDEVIRQNYAFNIINSRRIKTKSGVKGYVNFADIEEAENFIKVFNGQKFADSILTVDFNFA